MASESANGTAANARSVSPKFSIFVLFAVTRQAGDKNGSSVLHLAIKFPGISQRYNAKLDWPYGRGD
jgi:hypothetical protein